MSMQIPPLPFKISTWSPDGHRRLETLVVASHEAMALSAWEAAAVRYPGLLIRLTEGDQVLRAREPLDDIPY